jgi:hypothetical protein
MDDDQLLTRTIDEWRRPVRLRAEWRDALLREVAALPVPRSQPPALHPNGVRNVWTLRPLTALAAAVLILAVGLATGVLISRGASTGISELPNAASGLTTVRFVIVAPSARQVSVVGDFNRWDATANPMRPSRDGQSWVLELPLQPGRHTYAFVVDGDVMRDPTAPSLPDDDFGVPNSIIFVANGRT